MEQECERFATQVRQNFESYLRRGDEIILPFGCVFGGTEAGPAMVLIPFGKRHPPNVMVAVIQEAVKRINGDAFVLCYDGHSTKGTTHDPRSAVAATRKDTFFLVWRTSWGTESCTAIRYERIENRVEFEDSIKVPVMMGIFDIIFPPNHVM